jgi:hypothetical protein
MDPMLAPRRTIAALLTISALGIAACGGDSDTEKAQQRAAELQQQGADLRENAEQAAQDVKDGTKSADEAAAEIQQGAQDLQENATDAAAESIDDVKDNGNVPDAAEDALEQAQQDLEQSTP